VEILAVSLKIVDHRQDMGGGLRFSGVSYLFSANGPFVFMADTCRICQTGGSCEISLSVTVGD